MFVLDTYQHAEELLLQNLRYQRQHNFHLRQCELRRRQATLFASRAKKLVVFIQAEGCASEGGDGCSCGWGRTTKAVTAGWVWRRRALCLGPSARRA